MNQILDTIENLRSKSEATRFRILVITVVGIILVVGILWGAMLRYRFSQTITFTQKDDAVEVVELPSVGELIKKGGASMTSSTKGFLRNLLLGDEKPEPIPPPPTTMGNPIRLPAQR